MYSWIFKNHRTEPEFTVLSRNRTQKMKSIYWRIQISYTLYVGYILTWQKESLKVIYRRFQKALIVDRNRINRSSCRQGSPIGGGLDLNSGQSSGFFDNHSPPERWKGVINADSDMVDSRGSVVDGPGCINCSNGGDIHNISCDSIDAYRIQGHGHRSHDRINGWHLVNGSR